MKVLRDYQNRAIQSIRKTVGSGIDKTLLVLATGLGKTVVAVKTAEEYNKTLFIIDKEELANQAAISFIKEKFDDGFAAEVEKVGFIDYINSGGQFPGGFSMGLIKADTFLTSGSVVIASVQTLTRRLHLLDPNEFQCVIVDEAHNYMARSYNAAVSFFTPKLRLGLTATKTRHDGLELSDLFDGITYEYNIGDGIKDGYLVELDAVKIKTNISLDKVRTTGGEFNQGDLSDEINTLSRNFLIADSYLKYCNGRKALGFCCTIQHAIDIAEAFRQKGINADAVSSNEELTGNRQEKVRLFKEGNIQVLFNVNLLTTGFDQDDISCLIMARPTKSLTLFTQMVGRGTRTLKGTIDSLDTKEERWKAIKKSGKKDSIILDICDMTTRHDLVNCTTLDLGKDPDDRLFITQEKRDKLNEAREQRRVGKLQHVRKEDEIVKLFAIPRLKINNSFQMSLPATQAQLDAIARMGYPTKDIFYNQGQITAIYGSQRCSENAYYQLKNEGYDVSGFISVSQAAAAFKEIEARKQKPKYKTGW